MGGKVGLIVAVLAGLLALMFNNWYLANKERELETEYGVKVKVVVAVRAINSKTIIDKSMLADMLIPKKYMQPSAVVDQNTAVGMVNLVPLPRGVQILQSSLVPVGPDTGISVKVPVGTRGVIGKADDNLLSLINPGDNLDMVLTLPDPNFPGNCVLTRLQNIKVLSIGKDFGGGGDRQNFLTFALPPEQAQLFILAQGQGKVTYVVRPFNDKSIFDLNKTSYPALYEKQKITVPADITKKEDSELEGEK